MRLPWGASRQALPCLGRGCPPASSRSQSAAPGSLSSPGTPGEKDEPGRKRRRADQLSPTLAAEHRRRVEAGPRGRGDAPCPRSGSSCPADSANGTRAPRGDAAQRRGRPGPAPADRPGRGCQAGQGARGTGGGACPWPRGRRALDERTCVLQTKRRARRGTAAPRHAQRRGGPARLGPGQRRLCAALLAPDPAGRRGGAVGAEGPWALSARDASSP